MATATPIQKAIPVISSWEVEGTHGLETPCSDYGEYIGLPAAVEYQGRRYGKTGWNSDKDLAYYQTSKNFALAIDS